VKPTPIGAAPPVDAGGVGVGEGGTVGYEITPGGGRGIKLPVAVAVKVEFHGFHGGTFVQVGLVVLVIKVGGPTQLTEQYVYDAVMKLMIDPG
jgi:hypothetical protein